MWLVLAAPASFLSAESASQDFLASDSHFVMKLLSAAPASFLSVASLLQVANALVAASESAAARTNVFMRTLLLLLPRLKGAGRELKSGDGWQQERTGGGSQVLRRPLRSYRTAV